MCSYREYNFISIFLLLLLTIVKGYPTVTRELGVQPDEKTFPNGTVVGKYAYVDKEGNPIQVKYYADESSYGVELNSLKVVQNNDGKDASTTQPLQPCKESKESILDKDHTDPNQFDFFESIKYQPPGKNLKAIDPLDFLNKDATKAATTKNKYKNPEYEIYMQNDLSGPNKHCNSKTDKVLVYNFDRKEVRNDRKSIIDEEPTFCERF